MDILWLPFSIATIMLYGFGQVFAKETRTNVSSSNLLLLLGGNILVMWAAYWAAFREPGSYDLWAWLKAVVAAALSGFAFVTYYESLKHGKVSVVGTIAGAYAPWTVVLALAFLGESMSISDGLGVTLVVLAMLVFAYSANGDSAGAEYERLGIAFASASLFFWGTSAALAKGVISDIGNTNFIGVYALVCPAVWIAYWLATEKGKFERPRSNSWLLELSMLCIAGGGITLYLAIQNGNVSIVSPITNLYPIVTIAVAKIRLKEQLSLRQGVALAMLLISIPLFSF
ncbi:MAG: DMT family transporter [Thermoplasmata archaeon]